MRNIGNKDSSNLDYVDGDHRHAGRGVQGDQLDGRLVLGDHHLGEEGV